MIERYIEVLVRKMVSVWVVRRNEEDVGDL